MNSVYVPPEDQGLPWIVGMEGRETHQRSGYLPKGKDVYIHIRPTLLPEATTFSCLYTLNLYELASSNRNAAYSQQTSLFY
jgi:hypothetical protein